jgi:hypothetical protein
LTYINVDTNTNFAPVPVPITNRFTGSDGTAITFNRAISDSGSHWGGSAMPDVVCKGGSVGYLAKGICAVRYEDFTTGTELQFWQVEYDGSGNIVEVSYSEEFYAPTEHDDLPRDDPDHDVSVIHKRHPIFAYVNPGHTLGFRVTQFHDSTAGFRIGLIDKANCTLEIDGK